MKTTNIILAAVLAATSAIQAATAEHKLPAPMPEFKTPEQLAKWSDEMMAKAAAADALADKQSNSGPSISAFYTGKPYVSENGGYAFKFRQYDPELNRWTSADPSGFPDGANNRIYAPAPTSELDPLGLKTSKTLIYNGQYTNDMVQQQESFISYQINLSDGTQTTATLSASVANPSAQFQKQYSNYESSTATSSSWSDIGKPTTTRASGKSPGQVSVADLPIPKDWTFSGWSGNPIIDPTAVILGPSTVGPSPGTSYLRHIDWIEQTTFSMAFTIEE